MLIWAEEILSEMRKSKNLVISTNYQKKTSNDMDMNKVLYKTFVIWIYIKKIFKLIKWTIKQVKSISINDHLSD